MSVCRERKEQDSPERASLRVFPFSKARVPLRSFRPAAVSMEDLLRLRLHHPVAVDHTLFREGRINKMSVCRERKEQDSPERASRASRSGYFRPKHNFEYSRFQKLVFRYVPFALRLYRWKIYPISRGADQQNVGLSRKEGARLT
jgi:hypothetical protein